jgi:AraC-like DNA-binding protein
MKASKKTEIFDEYSARTAAAQPVLAALEERAEVLPVKELQEMVQHLVDTPDLFDSQFTAKKWLQTCRLDSSPAIDLFKTTLGITPAQLLREVRLEIGARLLAMTKLTAAAIGHLVGFGPSTFERAFPGWAGQSIPSSRPGLRRLYQESGNRGLAILSRPSLLELAAKTAPVADYDVVFHHLLDQVFHRTLHSAPSNRAVMEKRLAAELWESRLAPEPHPAVVEVCQGFFQTDALSRLLAAKTADSFLE